MRRPANPPDNNGDSSASAHVEVEPLIMTKNTNESTTTNPTTTANETSSSSSSSSASSIPVGHWRDSLWDLCRYGPMHPTVWNACCCAPVAAGQVITRLNLPGLFWGSNSNSAAGVVFQRLLSLAVSFWILRVLFLILIALLDPNVEAEWGEWTEPGWIYHILVFADNILAYVYMGFTVLLLCHLRSQVRNKYAIPAVGYLPRGTEDFCCSLCCPCLVAAQMMRHTTDYDRTPARCCTATGLSSPHHASLSIV